MQTIKLTIITAHDCDLAKTFSRDANGAIVSSAIAHMTRGTASICELDGLTQLEQVLDTLAPNQAITCGVPLKGDTELSTRAGVEFNPNAVARTNEAFRYPDRAALFPIDVDVDGDTYRSVSEVLDALEAASPWLLECLRVARPSSSSYVDGRGVRGVHVYLAVSRGADIPALGKRLQMEQWAAGRGHVTISKSGALLVRQLSDALVYQPSRLMFEAAPVLPEDGSVERNIPEGERFIVRGPALRAGRPVAYRTPEGLLDVQALPAVREIEWRRFDTARKQAKDAKRADAKRIALAWHAQQAADAGLDSAQGDLLGVRALRVLDTRSLPTDWPLAVWVEDKRVDITVADALRAADDAQGTPCADPFESLSRKLSRADLNKAEIVRMNGKLGVWSHKLQEFFEFGGATGTQAIETPVEVAAEKLCGLLEHWPDARDKKRNSLDNVTYALTQIANEAGVFPRFNVCTGMVEADDAPTPGEFLRAASRVGCSSVQAGTLAQAYETLAMQHEVDPWRDAILRLPSWDGNPRLDTVFTDVFDTDDGPAIRHVARAFFAGLVMRQLFPGAPAPIIPILIGKQGVGKSLFVTRLAEGAGFPAPTQLFLTDDRRMSMAAGRAPIAELCEMAGYARKEAEDLKRWISDDRDVYRAPYARQEVEHPRRFVLIGTANKNEVNRDETGNRRLFPIEIRGVRQAGWHVEIPQILAEAKARFCSEWSDYHTMLRSASDLVRDYNEAAMQRGEGAPISDLDDLLPGILMTAVRNAGPEVGYSTIRARLEANATGRKINAREVARWLTARGWVARQARGGLRTYTAPAHFLLDMEQIEAAESPNTTNPFTPNHGGTEHVH